MKSFIVSNPEITVACFVVACGIIFILICFLFFNGQENKILKFKLALINTVLNNGFKLKKEITEMVNDPYEDSLEFHDIIKRFNEISKKSHPEDDYQVTKNLTVHTLVRLAIQDFQLLENDSATLLEILSSLKTLGTFGKLDFHVGQRLKDDVLICILEQKDFDFCFVNTLKGIASLKSTAEMIVALQDQENRIKKVFHPVSKLQGNLLAAYEVINAKVRGNESNVLEIIKARIEIGFNPQPLAEPLPK